MRGSDNLCCGIMGEQYKHIIFPRRHPQHCPYSSEPKNYGSEARSPLPIDTTRKLSDKEIKAVQKIFGSILC